MKESKHIHCPSLTITSCQYPSIITFGSSSSITEVATLGHSVTQLYILSASMSTPNLIQEKTSRKRNFMAAISTASIDLVYDWIGTVLSSPPPSSSSSSSTPPSPSSSSQIRLFIEKLKEQGIQIRSLQRMNTKHFVRMGLDEKFAYTLFVALKSPPVEFMSVERDEVQVRALTTVAVIGTAGRDKRYADKMNADLFHEMCEKTERIITQDYGLSTQNIQLVSGGAAWSDHVAVRLYLSGKYGGLKIYLPCRWLRTPNASHYDSGETDWRTNPGKMANKYHIEFSKSIVSNTLLEIDEARQRGGEIIEGSKGFHSRNTSIAQSSHLIAFTWEKGSCPTKGGTRDTWNKCKALKKIHVSLNVLNVEGFKDLL